MLCFAGFNLWPCTTELLPEWETSALSIHRDEGDTISRVLWYSKVLNLSCRQSFNAWTKSRFKQIKWKSNTPSQYVIQAIQYIFKHKGGKMLFNICHSSKIPLSTLPDITYPLVLFQWMRGLWWMSSLTNSTTILLTDSTASW